MSKLTKKEYKAKYDDFFVNKEQYLEDFRKRLGKQTPFDFSTEEIEQVDDFFRANKDKFDNENPIYSEFEKFFYAYFGIAYITKYGGEWELSLHKKDTAYGTPVIQNDANYYRTSVDDWKWLIKEDRERRMSFFFRLDELVPHGIDDIDNEDEEEDDDIGDIDLKEFNY